VRPASHFIAQLWRQSTTLRRLINRRKGSLMPGGFYA